MAAPDKGGRLRVVSEGEARALARELEDVMRDLAGVMAEEDAHLAAGRLRAGLAQEDRKAQLAAAYLRGLEAAKANAVALARFAPDAVVRLRAAHEGFRAAVERNQAVIGTARAVSEGLVRQLATDMAGRARHQGYGAAVAPRRPPAGTPLMHSSCA